ncbi:MAG: YbdK family carboxylate-amine ligase [Ramlibacter sp.]
MLEPFRSSQPLTLGVELELQLVNTHDYDLAPYSDEMLRLMAKLSLPGAVVPEMTSSMIEISTGVCNSSAQVLGELTVLRDALVRCADKLNIAVVGGGTHPFQQWHRQRIYDKARFRELSELYGYLSKQFTVFGQHVHVGCPDADAALLMLHRMSRYIPHFIALSASSPFVQAQDTQFDSARLNSVSAFPMSGRAPFTLSWQAFQAFFAKTTRTGVVKSMKDFYWDIRPKPEYGTIEIRVFDTPLTVERAAALAGFVQALAAWFLHDDPFVPQEDDYMVYTYNRFQACRFGLEAVYVDPVSGRHMPLREHLLATLRRLAPHAQALGAGPAMDVLAADAEQGANDARWLRQRQARERLLAEVVRQAALRFQGRR